MRILVLFLLLFFGIFKADAQDLYAVKGTVSDSIGPIPGVIIKVKYGGDSLTTVTEPSGAFVINNIKSKSILFSASLIGYQVFGKRYNLEKSLTQLEPVILKTASNQLAEVVIKNVTPVKVKEDTVQYDAGSFKVRPGDAVEEMVKKLPGVTVDKDGNVSVQGKPITKVRVNGKDFFGGDVASAIQNLPADIIKNLQVIDDYGEKAKLTKIKTGDPEKVLNLTIQPDKKKGYFTRTTGGLGSEDRFIVNTKGNRFVGERQLSFNGSINNTNTRGGGGDGLTNSKNLGFNYKDEYGKKITVYGDYRFNSRDNNTIRSSFRQQFFNDYTQRNNDNNFGNNFSYDHNVSANLEYKIDTMNYMKVSPFMSYNKSKSNFTGINSGFIPSHFDTAKTLVSELNILSDNRSNNNNSSPNLGFSLFFNHKFSKKGRNFSINANGNTYRGNSYREVRNTYTNTDSLDQLVKLTNQFQNVGNDNRTGKLGTDVAYMEPIGKSGYLEINHHWDRADNKNIREIVDIDAISQALSRNDSTSNNFAFAFIKNRSNINYRIEKEKFDFRVGLSGQQVTLRGNDITRGNQTKRNFYNWIPNGRFVYKFTKTKVVTTTFDTWTNQPNFFQIQPIVDVSNIRYLVHGNPNLKPEFTNKVYLEYKQSDYERGDLFSGNISYSTTKNKIVNNVVRFQTATDRISNSYFLNADGFYGLNGYYSYSKPFFKKKLTVTYEGGGDYGNYINYVDNERNLSKNLNINQGLKFRTDIEDIMDAEIRTWYNVNKTDYSISNFTDRNATRLVLGFEGRNYFFKNWTLGYDFSKTINKGYNNFRNPVILSAYIERRFWKKDRAHIRLQGFDLFNQNTGINRDVWDNVISDSQTNRLARYFLLTCSMKLQKFGG